CTCCWRWSSTTRARQARSCSGTISPRTKFASARSRRPPRGPSRASRPARHRQPARQRLKVKPGDGRIAATSSLFQRGEPTGMSHLDERVAIVRGASRGIGREVALLLARRGATVVVNYNQNAGAAEDVVKAIESENGTAMAVQADVSDLEQAQRLVKAAV